MQNLVLISVPEGADDAFVERIREILDGSFWLRIGHCQTSQELAGKVLRRKETFELRAFHKLKWEPKTVVMGLREFLEAFGGGLGVVVVRRELAVAFADHLLGDLEFRATVVQPCPVDSECFLLRRQESGKFVSFQVITDNTLLVVGEPKPLMVVEPPKMPVAVPVTLTVTNTPLQAPPALSFLNSKVDRRGNKLGQLPAPLRERNLKAQLTYKQSGQVLRTRPRASAGKYALSDTP